MYVRVRTDEGSKNYFNISIFQFLSKFLAASGCGLLDNIQWCWLNRCSFIASNSASTLLPVQKISGCSVSKMKGLAVLLWSPLLCSVCATIKTLASSSNAIASHYKNAKYQESSPSSGILSTVAGYKTLFQGSEADPKGLAVGQRFESLHWRASANISSGCSEPPHRQEIHNVYDTWLYIQFGHW